MKFKLAILSAVSFVIIACGDGGNSGSSFSGAMLNRDGTLAGPDANGNGVRDDIDTYINGLSDTEEQKAALRQMSASYITAITTDTNDNEALKNAANKMIRAASCFVNSYRDGTVKSRTEKRNTLKKYTINTPERFTAYADYSKAISGSVTSSPQGDGCDE